VSSTKKLSLALTEQPRRSGRLAIPRPAQAVIVARASASRDEQAVRGRIGGVGVVDGDDDRVAEPLGDRLGDGP